MKYIVHIDSAFCDYSRRSSISIMVMEKETMDVIYFSALEGEESGFTIDSSVQAEIAAAIVVVDMLEKSSVVFLHTDCMAVCQSVLGFTKFKSPTQTKMSKHLRTGIKKKKLLLMPILTSENESARQRMCHESANNNLKRIRVELEESKNKRKRRRRK